MKSRVKERVGKDNKEERLPLFWERKRRRQDACKVGENNTKTKMDEGNRKSLNRKTGRYGEISREKK